MKDNQNLQLGIAQIGDLLLNKKITLMRDGKSLEDVQLNTPNYQRPYKWTAKNAIQLLDDIIEAKNANKEVYRVGTLILNYEDDVYNIVDGQQRITTFSLLLLALLEDEKRIDFLKQDVMDNSYTRTNVANNYRAFVRRRDAMLDERTKELIQKKSEKAARSIIYDDRKVSDLRDFIEKQCEIIVVITNDISEAFQFFDSQNARGKKLFPHDLLKAYHLREMNGLSVDDTVRIVRRWEGIDQGKLADLFENLYKVREWLRGNEAWELSEHNIDKFKGINKQDNSPYAQFFKGAYAYADMVNVSAMPFVSGMRNLNPFQLEAPIVAGKPFFDYVNHYFEILKDIQNNEKYVGYFVNDNIIVKTLDLRKYKNGTGNRITRKLFDLAALLYVDRFCPDKPTRSDLDVFEQFLVMDFIWAYSLRAQYYSLGWASAQNYIMGDSDLINSFNLYKTIVEAASPEALLSELADKISPLSYDVVKADTEEINVCENGIYTNYLHFFVENKFYSEKK